jgi:transcription-repair coupling factor (superfamily II helicase)
MRAAFKAVMDGKQVAVLVPTTVLDQQHYETIPERMGRFPVAVEKVSRFGTKAEQAAVLARAAQKKVDVLSGTHRLLQRDVKLADLGLVIIDEEQRIGWRRRNTSSACARWWMLDAVGHANSADAVPEPDVWRGT